MNKTTRYDGLEALFKRAITEYTGEAPASVQVHPDPKVEGSYAARARFKDGDKVDFLVAAGSPVSADGLEEVTFETWPPRSGNLKFFV